MHKCDKCRQTFTKSQGLKRHLERKRPCIAQIQIAQVANSCERCGNTFSRIDSLIRHQQKHCAAPIIDEARQEIDELKARLARLEKQSNSITVTNVSGPVTNVSVPITNIVNIKIAPWGSPLQLTDGDVEAALSKVPGLAGTPTLPEVVNTLMELVKKAHTQVDARNIHLNPKRADQAMALTAGGWATLPLAEATTALFDAASARIAIPESIQPKTPSQHQLRIHNLRTEMPAQYRVEKEIAVQLGLRPMEAHLANTRPGGPGPLLIEYASHAAPAQAAAAVRPPQASGLERIKAALLEHPLECSETGALLVGWIVSVTQTARVSGKELFEALNSGDPELEAARIAAQVFTEEKMRPRAAP
jgi:hypothetical protein